MRKQTLVVVLAVTLQAADSFPPSAEQKRQLQDKMSQYPDAERNYQKAIELQADNAIAKNNLAWLYAEHGGNLDVALRLAQEAKEVAPDNPSVSDTLGWIYVKTNTLGNAIELLQQSVDKMPKNPAYYYHLGVAYFRAGRMLEAKKFLEASLTLQPGAPNAADAKKLLASFKN